MLAQLSANHINWVLNLVNTISFDSTTFGYLHKNQVCFNIGVAPVTKPNINSIERALCSFTPLCSILSKFLALCGISVIVTRHQISKNIFWYDLLPLLNPWRDQARLITRLKTLHYYRVAWRLSRKLPTGDFALSFTCQTWGLTSLQVCYRF